MILSIDPGIRNLSFCISSASNKKDLSTYCIHLWENYNTLESDEFFCESIQKNKKICNKKCSYKYKTESKTEFIYTCKTHFPKDIQIKNINNHKMKSVNDYTTQDLIVPMLNKIQNIYTENIELFKQLQKIVIELQPKCNPKSAMISHILFGKLTDLYLNSETGSIPDIKYVRASQKLKAYTGPDILCTLKGSYAKRKWLGVQYAKWFLENKFSDEQKEKWLPIFESNKKQNDLSDTYLMAINCLHGMPKKQMTDKNGKSIK